MKENMKEILGSISDVDSLTIETLREHMHNLVKIYKTELIFEEIRNRFGSLSYADMMENHRGDAVYYINKLFSINKK